MTTRVETIIRVAVLLTSYLPVRAEPFLQRLLLLLQSQAREVQASIRHTFSRQRVATIIAVVRANRAVGEQMSGGVRVASRV